MKNEYDIFQRSAWKRESESQNPVGTFAGLKQIDPGLGKTKAFVEFDGMSVGFVNLKPNFF
jgi:hypothetical protein